MTTTRLDHDEVDELLGAYALHGVEPDEARLVEAHLDECTRCRHALDELREAAAAFGQMSEPPPPALWERIAESTVRTSDRTAASDRSGLFAAVPTGPDIGSHAGTAAELAAGAAAATSGRALAEVRRRWRPATMLTAAAVAVAAVVALSAGLVNANHRVSDLQSALVQQGQASAVRSALDSPGHQVLSLRSPAGRLAATLVVRKNGTGYVVASHLKPLGPSKTYQLWADVATRPVSVGLLGDRLGRGVTFALGSSLGVMKELMLTVEPRGGVTSPTESPIAVAPLAT